MTVRLTTSKAAGVDRQFATTLERGLRVLACFSAAQPELSNSELAAACSLPRPTISRLTHTLVRLGYLRRCAHSMRYELSTGVLRLGYPVLAGLLHFRRIAAPHMAQLATAVEGVCGVSVRDRMQMVSIESVTQRDVLKRRPGAGIAIHFAASTLGLAWAVSATANERERALRELAHAHPELLDPMRQSLQQAFRQQARDGYVARHGMNRPDTLVAATTLRRRAGEELLVLHCARVAPQFKAQALERDAGAKLLAAARAIDAAMAQG